MKKAGKYCVYSVIVSSYNRKSLKKKIYRNVRFVDQDLSWINISSRFLLPINKYIECSIQILTIIFLRLHGEKQLINI